MRTLLFLRGSPGCGKTTWIEQNDLEQYTLSPDDIRKLWIGPELTLHGREVVGINYDSVVWDALFNMLGYRMQRGEFVVIDATASRTYEMSNYKVTCDWCNYKIFCVDFTDVPMEVAIERNHNRPIIKRVPDAAIRAAYDRFATQEVSSGITVIKPDELDKVWLQKTNLDNYKKVHVIGDIHGCYTALMGYFDLEGGIKDDEFYIFTGDYIDRGIENVETIKFLMDMSKRDNVFLLEGNHERWLWAWGADQLEDDWDTDITTEQQFNDSDLKRGDILRFYKKLEQCAYYEYAGHTYFVSHGGISALPHNLTLIPAYQMINGVGGYEDVEECDHWFSECSPENARQIHGHRNLKHLPIEMNSKCFNLEGGVEFGGELRAVQLPPDGTVVPVEVKNTVFDG